MDQARRVLPGEPAERRGAAGLAGQAGRGRAAVPQQPEPGPARRAGCVGAAGIRVAGVDAGAGPAGRRICRRPGPARTGTARRTSPATTRSAWARVHRRSPTSPSWSSSPSSCRRAIRARRWTTSTSTRWPASSATRPPSTPRRWPSSSARWSTRASWTATRTVSGGCRPRRCDGSARRRYAMWRNSFPAATVSVNCDGPAPRVSSPAPPGRGNSATPSRGTSPGR